MSLQIYIAFTGERLLADPISFTSPEALRSWIQNHGGIAPQRQILMTARGKNVKQQHLLTETEVFVYDKQYLTSDAESFSVPTKFPPSPVSNIGDAPKTISDQNTLQAWRSLFMERRAWALELVEIANACKISSQTNLAETSVIVRAAGVALENLKNHVGSIQHKYEGTRSWAQETLKEHRAALADWENSFNVLKEVPARRELAFLLCRPSTPTKHESQTFPKSSDGMLHEFLSIPDVQDAVATLTTSSSSFSDSLQQLEQTMQDLRSDTSILEERQRSEATLQPEEVESLFEEAETLAKKLSSDYEDVLRLQDNPKSVASASRKAVVHTRDVIPSLKAILDEINQTGEIALNVRNDALQKSVQILREIAAIEYGLSGIQSQVAALEMEPEGVEALDTINAVFQLPVAFGSTLIESIRRTEWLEKMRMESNLLNEEMNLLKDEEQRRRKRWVKSMGCLLQGVPDDTITAIAIEPPSNSNEWPTVTRSEIFTYIQDLGHAGIDDAVQQVTQLMKDLEHPAKQRKRAAKAFKQGSVYDAGLGLGQSSVFLRDNDASVKALRDDKLKLDDKLRASDSRVRKLEDLLHRQSQMGRPSGGNFGAPSDFERHASPPIPTVSPRPSDLLSRRSSVSSRRMSSNQAPEDKALIQRIVSLEADNARLQREAHVERRSSVETRDKMQEAESTKRDLMANFEAQKQEFDDERQLLEDESHKLKIRLEEAEDELDRVLGSRDHQNLTSDRIISKLQAELDQLRSSSADDLAKLHAEAASLRNEIASHQDKVATLDRHVQQTKEEKSGLTSRNMMLADELREAESARQEHVNSLQFAHLQLSPNGSAPDDLQRLVKAIEILSEGHAIHVRGMEDAASLATAENSSLNQKLAQVEGQIEELQRDLDTKSADSSTAQNALAQERSKLASVRSELADEQRELQNLRSKFAAGETGSEALKDSLAKEEQKTATLAEKLALANSKIESFELEVNVWKEKMQSMNTAETALRSRLEKRGARAKELSQRLFSYNDRLIRMLEQLGFSVVRQDDKLAVQRASKVNASTILSTAGSIADISTAMRRTLSGSGPPEHYSNPSDLETLYWMSDTDDVSEEDKFHSFISSLARLDADVAVDTVAKRYKDVEILARKYQKDSRAYREKSHRLQSEAHEKIAYRTFKEGDLALFLPTRNQATRPWAAFNVGAPHYFLREQDTHKLQTRDWLLARISKVEERVVDLSRSLTNGPRIQHDQRSINTEASDGASTRSVDDENPFELSDGLRWYMIDAYEEKPGAPSTPGLGKSTVAATNVDVKGSFRPIKDTRKVRDSGNGGNAVTATKTLNKSLDSRRSSSASKKGHTSSPSTHAAPTLATTGELTVHDRPAMVEPAEADNVPGEEAREDARVFEEVRKDLLFGP